MVRVGGASASQGALGFAVAANAGLTSPRAILRAITAVARASLLRLSQPRAISKYFARGEEECELLSCWSHRAHRAGADERKNRALFPTPAAEASSSPRNACVTCTARAFERLELERGRAHKSRPLFPPLPGAPTGLLLSAAHGRERERADTVTQQYRHDRTAARTLICTRTSSLQASAACVFCTSMYRTLRT
jgi:hypothetical protein